ncbi:GGDEF domain-containing protein [Alteromonas oceanisediminis]|uniref:GGDEF domain-containing protein n=1 Tax=Alteromonas oceanisediminis TaxID=2836180 RepID=UPI001BDAD664|nr:GGDEF domain-containing protein [Alteromonas oceanisediminis]MBT0585414.1 GGDEF domain-containing protein [Alteromonas oceanisediminis]
MPCIRQLIVFSALFSGLLGAKASDPVDAFIDDVQTVTYDCPDPSQYDQLESYLSSDTLSAAQRFALSTEKSHFLLCRGKTAEAHALLFDLIDQDDVNTDSYYYASAIYQVGFGYDVLEEPQRCDYYAQARELSSPEQHSDVFLSASLGMITNCMQNLPLNERLGRMFRVLERYSETDNHAALAHIHNSIGLVYGGLGQHVLAAEQFIKAHELGLESYTGSNQLTILISAITSLLASGQFETAYEYIVEFEKINRDVATPLTNFYYYHALTGYYYRTNKIDEMKNVLPEFKRTADEMSNSFITAMASWYSVVPCVYEKNQACMREYIRELENTGGKGANRFANNPDYLALKTKMYLALGDLSQAEIAFDNYVASAKQDFQNDQDSASILSAANLYSQINTLESEIKATRRTRNNIIIFGLLTSGLIIALSVYFIRKRYMAHKSIDPITQVLNAETAMAKIGKHDAPARGRSHALALFDVSHLRQHNSVPGFTKSDYVLRKIAAALQSVTRDSDILGRYGPEQFIIFLPNIEEQGSKAFLDRVQAILSASFIDDDGTGAVNVHSSISVFVSTDKLNNLDEIVQDMQIS